MSSFGRRHFSARWSRCSVPVFCLIVGGACCTTAEGQDDGAEQPKRVAKAVVTDREGKPLEGARVVRLRWLKATADDPVVVTDADGEFAYPLDESSSEDTVSSYVIIHMPGYAVGALNLNTLPARARLWPKKPVALRVVDEEGSAVAGARVTLAEVRYDDEFLHADVPIALREETGAVSRKDGWAILRSTRPEFLHSVTVSAEGYGAQTFAHTFSDERFTRLCLSETTREKVRVMQSGQPAGGWSVVGCANEILTEHVLHEQRDNTDSLIPSGISFIGKTDEQGYVEMEHALMFRKSHFLLLNPQGRWCGKGTMVAIGDPNNVPVFHAEPSPESDGKQCTGKVVDAESGEPIAGVGIRFHRSGLPQFQATAISDEEGRLVAKLNAGEWFIAIRNVPDGYCRSITNDSTFVLDVHNALPTIKISKGTVIAGTIKGVDLAIRRARWIVVDWSANKRNRGTIRDQFEPDGSFRFAIPRGAKPEGFSIVSVGGGSEQLLVESKDPLVLVSSEEQP